MNEKTGIQRAVEMFDNSASKLATAVGCGVLRQHVEHWLKAGRVSVDRCAEVSAATGIPCEQLNDKANWKLLRVQLTKAARQRANSLRTTAKA